MIKFLRTLFVLAGIGLMPLSVMAQLTLDECQRLAKENYPLLKRYEIIRQSTEYSVRSINCGYVPQLSLNGQATMQSDVATLPDLLTDMLATNGYDVKGLSKEQYRIALDVNQTIWDGGNMEAQKKMVQADGNVQTIQTDVDMYAVRDRVNNLFFGTLLLEDKIHLNEDLQKLLLANCEKLTNMHKNGVAMQADVDAVRAEYLNVCQHHTALLSSLHSFKQMLALFIARPVEEISGLQKTVVSLPDTREVLRPELKLFDAQLEKNDAQYKLLNSGIRPRFSLFVQGYWGYPGYDMFHDMFDHAPTFNGMVGVRVGWNIGKLYSHHNDRRKLDMAREQIENAREVFLFNNRLQVSEESNAVERYRKMLTDDNEIIELRTSVRQSAETKLEYGIIDVNNLLQEIIRENEARINRSSHEIEMLKHIYELKHTVNQ